MNHVIILAVTLIVLVHTAGLLAQNAAPAGAGALELSAHGTDVFGLAFSPDGRWLASSDIKQQLIWPVGGTKPVAQCVSPRPQPFYQRLRWTRDSSRIQGGDGWDYLEWAWNGRPTTTPIKARVMIRGGAGEREEAWIMQLVANHAETKFLTGTAHQPGIGASELGPARRCPSHRAPAYRCRPREAWRRTHAG